MILEQLEKQFESSDLIFAFNRDQAQGQRVSNRLVFQA